MLYNLGDTPCDTKPEKVFAFEKGLRHVVAVNLVKTA